MDDRKVKMREIAEAEGISSERVHILHKHLNVKKLCANGCPKGELAPKQAKSVPGKADKVDNLIILIDYLEKGKTISSEYYVNLLLRLSDETKKKWPHLAKKKVLFCQDNAPAHPPLITMLKINELRFQLLSHPPYSADLAPYDYQLFSKLTK